MALSEFDLQSAGRGRGLSAGWRFVTPAQVEGEGFAGFDQRARRSTIESIEAREDTPGGYGNDYNMRAPVNGPSVACPQKR